MAVTNLTEKRIRDMPLGSGIHRDEQVKGLLVICHKSTKTYSVQGDVRRNGRHVRTVRVKIDRVDRIGLNEARRRAKGLMSQIQGGVDPTAKPAETGITLAAALEEHVGERNLSGRTEESYRDHLDRLMPRFRKRAVTDITRQEVRDLFDELKRKHGVNSAAGALRTMRAVINTARRIDETIGGNPVDGVRVPAPRKREVDEMDLKAFWSRTEELSPTRGDAGLTYSTNTGGSQGSATSKIANATMPSGGPSIASKVSTLGPTDRRRGVGLAMLAVGHVTRSARFPTSTT